jgi:hypothetical protein
MPPDFRVQAAPPAAWLTEALREIGAARHGLGAWEKALLIAAHLSEHIQDKGGVRADLFTTYRRIREGHGYCADFARVFMALAHAAGIFARQWAFSFDGFGGHGHVFVEVYDARRAQWIFLDVYNNFHVLDPVTGQPLSALELRAMLIARKQFPPVARNGPGRRGFPREEKLAEYYGRGLREWYLWWGNAPLEDDRWRLLRFGGTRLRTARHALRALLGLGPRISVYETRENRVQVERLGGLRRRVLSATLLCVVLAAALLLQLSGVRAHAAAVTTADASGTWAPQREH